MSNSPRNIALFAKYKEQLQQWKAERALIKCCARLDAFQKSVNAWYKGEGK